MRTRLFLATLSTILAGGNVKQGAGKAMNKPGLEAEGIAQERKGEAQQMVGKGKDAVKKVIDKA